MGVHIYIVDSNGDRVDEKALEWDWIRQAGDKEFVTADIWEFVNTQDHEYGIYRPKSFEQARRWVYSNIAECNQHRLLNILQKMEANKDLYFRFSW